MGMGGVTDGNSTMIGSGLRSQMAGPGRGAMGGGMSSSMSRIAQYRAGGVGAGRIGGMTYRDADMHVGED